MNLADIGQLVQARREALGLSQARLAQLAGLSRATINQLENGSLVDLGAAKLLALLNLLGLDLAAQPRAPQVLCGQRKPSTCTRASMKMQ